MQALKKANRRSGESSVPFATQETDFTAEWPLRCLPFLPLPRLLKVRNVAKEATTRRKSKGKGKGGLHHASTTTPSTTKDFAYLTSLPAAFRSNFHEKFHKREICYPFSKGNLQKRFELQVRAYLRGMWGLQTL